MENYDERYGDVVPYKPYLQDGKKHEMEDTDLTTGYWQAFYGAYSDRFPGRASGSSAAVADAPIESKAIVVVADEDDKAEALEGYAVAETAPVVVAPVAAPVVAPVVESYAAEKPVVVVVPEKPKKKVGAIVAAIVAGVLFLGFVVLSVLRSNGAVAQFFAGKNMNGLLNSIFGFDTDEVVYVWFFKYVAPGCTLIAIALALASIITLIVGLCKKKGLKVARTLSLIAVLVWVFSAVAIYFDGILAEAYAHSANYPNLWDYLNPHMAGGLQFGYYFGLLLLVVETCICKKALNDNK